MADQQDRVEVPESIDFVFTMGLRKIRDQIEVIDALDTKTGVIIGFVATSVAEILGFLMLAASEPETHLPEAWPWLLLLFAVGSVSVVTATVYGIFALKVEKFASGLRYPELVRRAGRATPDLKVSFLDDLLKSVEWNDREIQRKGRYSKIATVLVLYGLLSYTALSILLFVSIIKR